MNKYVAQFAALPWSRILVIAFLVGAAYYYFGLDEGVTPEQFQAADANKQKAQKSLEETQKAVSDLKKFREELDLMNAQFQQVVELMPADVNVADFMLQIREQATKAGARVKKIEPLKEIDKQNFYETRKLEISIEGNYSQILSFLSNLSRLKRLITVDKLSLAQAVAGEESKVSFNGTLTSYRYVAQAAPAPGGSPAPGAAATQPSPPPGGAK